jgi:hypothetical protein
MKTLSGIVGMLCLPLALEASTVPSANIIDLPLTPDFAEEVSQEQGKASAQIFNNEEQLLDYRAMLKEIHKLRQDPNQIRGEYQLELLAKEVVGKTFLFQDTIRVKRNTLVSGEMGLWFEPYEKAEVFLNMNYTHHKEFAALSEFDFIIAKAICKEIGKQCRFDLISLEKVEPFDPQTDFIDFTAWIAELEAARKDKTFFEYKSYLSNQADLKHQHLGYITGQLQTLTKNREGKFIMTILTNEKLSVQVECHPSYLEVLMNVQPLSNISMAVTFEKADTREGFFFSRGCMVRLKD